MIKQRFPALDPRIQMDPRRDFCGSAEEFQKNKHTSSFIKINNSYNFLAM